MASTGVVESKVEEVIASEAEVSAFEAVAKYIYNIIRSCHKVYLTCFEQSKLFLRSAENSSRLIMLHTVMQIIQH